MRHTLAKSRLFILALLFSFLGSSAPVLAFSQTSMIRVSPLKVGQSRWVVCSGNPINCIDPDGLEPLGRSTYLTNRHFDGSKSLDGSGRTFRDGVSIVGTSAILGPGGGLAAIGTAGRTIILTSPELTAFLVELGFGVALGGDAGPRPNLGSVVSSTTSSAARQLKANQSAGAAFERQVIDSLKRHFPEEQGFQVRPQVHFKTPQGGRRLDAVVYKGETPLLGIEAKAGNSPYHTHQLRKDLWIEQDQNFLIHLIRQPKQ